MALFSKKANKTEYDLPDWDSARGKKILENKLVAVDAKCLLNPKKARMSVIRTLKVGSPLAVQYAETQYGNFFIAIDPVTGLDIGSVSEGTSQYVLEKFRPGTKFVGRITELDKSTVRIEWRYI